MESGSPATRFCFWFETRATTALADALLRQKSRHLCVQLSAFTGRRFPYDD
jgi:hypothetical protein